MATPVMAISCHISPQRESTMPSRSSPSQATIESLFNQELESNVKAMEKGEGKTAGKLGSALDRLKNMRGGGAPKKDDEEKK